MAFPGTKNGWLGGVVLGRVGVLAPVSLILTFPYILVWTGLLSASQTLTLLITLAAVVGGSSIMALVLSSVRGVPRWTALAAIAIASLVPEFAIETRYAWLAVGEEGSQYASMTLAAIGGTSRFLIGVGWPLIIILFCFRARADGLRLGANQLAGLVLLFMIALYAFLIFMRGYLWVMDTPILLLMSIVFFWRLSRSQGSQRQLNTDSDAKARGVGWRGTIAIVLIAYAATATFLASNFLAEELIASNYSIDTSSLLRWTIPLVSKLPLLGIIAALVWQRNASMGVSMLFTSQITVWSALVAILPVVMFAGSTMSGNMELVWLEDSQRIDVLLTASQVVFAVAVMSGKTVSRKSALVLFGLFVVELTLTSFQPRSDASLVPGIFILLYLCGAVMIFLLDRYRLRALGRAIVASKRVVPAPVAIPVVQTPRLRATNRIEQRFHGS